jgi:A/G-specific adenine glycosylase
MQTFGDTQRHSLLNWFGAESRDLPWRKTCDPWAIVVSELMLQQTQVDRVLPKYAEFLNRFPTVESCSRATFGEILSSWNGLGYNRRAKYLHELSIAVRIQFDGTFPSDIETLQSLPGIGPYTARAIAVFAFRQPHAVVDTNVARVIARFDGVTYARARELQQRADEWLDLNDPWTWNQALLDLGARRCSARTPQCPICPLVESCKGANASVDTAIGSKGVSGRQSRFAGSDREGRGRLVKTLTVDGAIPIDRLAAVMGWPDDVDRAVRVANTLVDDQIVSIDSGWVRISGA